MVRYLIIVISVVMFCTSVTAQDAPTISCPNFKLVEPPGLVSTGDTADFRLEPDPKQQVEWTVSFGVIERGQGTGNISVRTSMANNLQLMKVSATVKGLPKDCSQIFEGSAVVGCCVDPVLLDEWGKIPANDQKGRLDNVIQELLENPTQVAFILLGYEKHSTEKDLLKRVKLIKDHIVRFRKFPANRIVVASESTSHDFYSVRIYRVPPSVVSAFCGNCRIH
jgi:hypothetical protein